MITGTLALGACAASRIAPVAAPMPGNPRALETLRGELRAIFEDPRLSHASWGVAAFSLATGETLYSLNASRLLVPASSQKLFTSAVAAAKLGWDYRFTTRLLATGPVNEAGTLEGDLIVVGNGDPTINPRNPERWRAFDDWAAHIASHGVRVVGGRLIGDDNAFAEPGWGAGWAWDDLALGYGAPASALQYHENQVEVTVGPGMEAGARAVITMSPAGSGLILDHRVTTGAAGSETRMTMERVPGTTFLTIGGSIAADQPPRVQMAAVDNPTRLYLNALREALSRHGIYVAGGVLDIDELPHPPDLTRSIALVTDQSPPLADIVDVAMKWSRNIYAETLLHTLCAAGVPATAEAGLEVLRQTLADWGVPPESYVARDGSGLSRYDYATPHAFVGLLTYTHLDPGFDTFFRATLPQAGISGTLANRLKGTAAEGLVFAKTGSMNGIRALSGYLTTVEGEQVAFSFLANGYRVPGADVDKVMDDALQVIVRFRRARTQ